MNPDLLARFVAYNDRHPAWGSLRIVLDDLNLDDRSVAFCEGDAERVGDVEGAALARVLLLMSEPERERLAALLD